MSIEVIITDGPLPPAPASWPAESPGRDGAIVRFEGIVRSREGKKDIEALTYEVYDPMATRELHKIAEEAMRTFGISAARVEHSSGHVPVGQCSFRLSIASPHRKEALQAMDWYIDRLKRDVPIWKSAVASCRI